MGHSSKSAWHTFGVALVFFVGLLVFTAAQHANVVSVRARCTSGCAGGCAGSTAVMIGGAPHATRDHHAMHTHETVGTTSAPRRAIEPPISPHRACQQPRSPRHANTASHSWRPDQHRRLHIVNYSAQSESSFERSCSARRQAGRSDSARLPPLQKNASLLSPRRRRDFPQNRREQNRRRRYFQNRRFCGYTRRTVLHEIARMHGGIRIRIAS